jgi:hypothetical protein
MRREAMDTKNAMNKRVAKAIRVLVCRVGAAPVVEELTASKDGHHLAAMQRVVGGLVTSIPLGDGVDLWCNDEGLLRGLPLNRVIPTIAPALPPGFEDAFIIRLGDDLAMPGEPGEWRIYGDFFLARADEDGRLMGVTDADIARYQGRWS